MFEAAGRDAATHHATDRRQQCKYEHQHEQQLARPTPGPGSRSIAGPGSNGKWRRGDWRWHRRWPRGDKVAVEEILQAAARAVTRLVAQEVLSEMFRRPHAGGVVGPMPPGARPLLPAGYLLPEWATHLRPHSPAGTVSRTVVIPLPQPMGLSVSTLQTAVSRTLIRELISLRQAISPPTP